MSGTPAAAARSAKAGPPGQRQGQAPDPPARLCLGAPGTHGLDPGGRAPGPAPRRSARAALGVGLGEVQREMRVAAAVVTQRAAERAAPVTDRGLEVRLVIGAEPGRRRRGGRAPRRRTGGPGPAGNPARSARTDHSDIPGTRPGRCRAPGAPAAVPASGPGHCAHVPRPETINPAARPVNCHDCPFCQPRKWPGNNGGRIPGPTRKLPAQNVSPGAGIARYDLAVADPGKAACALALSVPVPAQASPPARVII